MTTEGTVDKLRGMVDSGRVRKVALDLLAELDADNVRQLAETLDEMATAIETAREAVEEWADYEGDQDGKADVRDAAVDALEAVCNGAEYEVGEVDVPEWLKVELVRGPMEQMGER